MSCASGRKCGLRGGFTAAAALRGPLGSQDHRRDEAGPRRRARRRWRRGGGFGVALPARSREWVGGWAEAQGGECCARRPPRLKSAFGVAAASSSPGRSIPQILGLAGDTRRGLLDWEPRADQARVAGFLRLRFLRLLDRLPRGWRDLARLAMRGTVEQSSPAPGLHPLETGLARPHCFSLPARRCPKAERSGPPGVEDRAPGWLFPQAPRPSFVFLCWCSRSREAGDSCPPADAQEGEGGPGSRQLGQAPPGL